MFGLEKSKNNSSGERRQPGQQSRRPQPVAQKGKSVISYNTSRVVERPTADDSRPKPTYKRKRLRDRNWVRNLPSLIALIIITLSVLYCLGLSTDPKVVVSAASPQAIVLRNKGDYERGAQRILDQSLLSHTKFTINSSGFEKAFRAEFPEVDDVSIALPIVSRRPIVTISTAQPQLLLTSQGKVYVLDKRGTAIMMANDLSSSIRQSLPVVTDQSGLRADVGKTILPTEDIQFITGVMTQLKAKGLTAESITLPPTAHEVDIKLAGQPYYIKFNVDTNPREAGGSFLAAKQKLEQTNTKPAQYIDVRVPGRAYYQ